MHNHLSDIAGLAVGHAQDERLASGVTAIVFNKPAVASVSVLGGAPGGRDTGLLEPEMTVETVDAILLSGGSAFGLDAAGGAQSALAAAGRGFAVGPVRVPIVPQAIIFDLLNGGDKNWGARPPYWDLGRRATEHALAGHDASLGSVGAGLGATTANLKGGIGAASAETRSGLRVAALMVVNAIGTATMGDSPHFWAAPYERNGEFGGLGWPASLATDALKLRIKGHAAEPATTIGIVVTDAALTKPQAKRLAIMAQDGLARAIRPAHAPMDGDTIFAAATGAKPLGDPMLNLTELGMLAGDCLACAIARGVYEAKALPFAAALPDWKSRFGV
ncbi:MAG: P1 family peptidase [Beijerinckiaceae bacterium]|jgi:D-aminopeptidase|nr:P1 family peptidase [Beijerinckiaceae bacterium]